MLVVKFSHRSKFGTDAFHSIINLIKFSMDTNHKQ